MTGAASIWDCGLHLCGTGSGAAAECRPSETPADGWQTLQELNTAVTLPSGTPPFLLTDCKLPYGQPEDVPACKVILTADDCEFIGKCVLA